ncbi:hypothetical protein CDEST_01319 [Colletotrichum destructivum]|uniref:Heterokaryon incompatibility domain-containing protein n=1 Tax=Colletotrichum destructivum TaxID=34406 RepID=A0AAX4HZY1_9PEZI|nr:hypothetical protein CDEST_01319 [Colletotrichum destructivum]
MHVKTTMKSVCVPRRCGLCGFELQLGDNIVAVRRSDIKTSQPYKYSIVGFTDSVLGIDYVQCLGRCHHDEQRAGCHVDCIEITPDFTLAKVLEVTTPAFEPPVLADKRRIRWFQSRLAGILETTTRHLPHLPEEVRHNIAAWALDHRLTRRRLVIDCVNKRCAEKMSAVLSVKTSEKIYARHVEFEGVQYIAYLTNAASDDKDILLFDPTSPTSINSLFVANDHLGVRQLLFTDSSKQCTIEQEVGVWWRALKLESLGGRIQYHSDGLKLRDLKGETMVLPKDCWGVPQLAPECVRFESIWNAEPSYHMSVESCNDPQTTAYSLCWNSQIVMLHAHYVKENLDFYQSLRTTDETAIWQYMPLHADEVLTEIWKFNGPFRSAIGLLLVTNQGRSEFLGVQPRPNWSQSEWTLLDLPSDTTSRIYVETTTYGVRRLGFETPRPERRAQVPSFERPTSSYPIFRHGEYYAWNKAKLNEVVEIVPCRRHHRGRVITIGLLLHYTDGNSACVGQIRLDCLGEASSVDPACKLWLGFWLTDDGPCVSNAVLAQEQPTLPDCESWFLVDWCDNLEWWFSNRQCQLSYQGRLSPETTELGRSRV